MKVGGPIALIRDGDMIKIDADKKTLSVALTENELSERRDKWKAPPLKVSRGTLYKYIKNVASASKGCVTDE
jgi:dihydroxy-acid dehydratase